MDQQIFNDLAERFASLPKGVVSTGSFLAGSLIGFRLGIAQDQRREFNAAVEPIREYLLRSIERPDWPEREPGLMELDRFEHCLSPWRRKGFRKCWLAQEQQHKQCLRQNPTTGEVFYVEVDRMRKAYRRTLRYTARR